MICTSGTGYPAPTWTVALRRWQGVARWTPYQSRRPPAGYATRDSPALLSHARSGGTVRRRGRGHTLRASMAITSRRMALWTLTRISRACTWPKSRRGWMSACCIRLQCGPPRVSHTLTVRSSSGKAATVPDRDRQATEDSALRFAKGLAADMAGMTMLFGGVDADIAFAKLPSCGAVLIGARHCPWVH